MKKWILAIAVLALSAPAAFAQDELQTLKDQVKAQEKSIAQMKKQIDAVEKNAGSGSSSSDAWWNRINWSGDFRYRLETNDDEDPANNASGTEFRNRVRARLKMEAQVNEELNVIMRLASGSSSSPVSANQTLEGKLSKKDVWLDQMYLTYSPEALTGFNILAGKMANPFIRVGGNQVIWDSDINLEGGAFTYQTELSDQTQVGVNAGAIWLEQDWSTSNTNQYLWAVQGYIQQALDDISKITAGVSYYDFVKVQGQTGYTTGTGNSATSSVLANDYNLLEVFAELSTKIQETPFSVYGSFIQNQGTESGYNDDTAWVAGAKLNKATDPGTWQLGYEYREVEKDAVLGYFTESDFLSSTTGLTSGGIGSSGHKISYRYQVMKNVQAALNYVMAKQETSTVDYDFNKLQLDFLIKFK
ncbi:MAG: putative porin [Phycisphaerae bacterium]|nr:putative porin [Phycisphaerae bacterium]